MDYLTPKEAHDKYGVSISTVYYWCHQKQVTLLYDTKAQQERKSKYLIEAESLKRKVDLSYHEQRGKRG